MTNSKPIAKGDVLTYYKPAVVAASGLVYSADHDDEGGPKKKAKAAPKGAPPKAGR
jgi:hypothetical protein